MVQNRKEGEPADKAEKQQSNLGDKADTHLCPFSPLCSFLYLAPSCLAPSETRQESPAPRRSPHETAGEQASRARV